jgi:hypothetical protein
LIWIDYQVKDFDKEAIGFVQLASFFISLKRQVIIVVGKNEFQKITKIHNIINP